jgi:glucokinase
MTDAVVAIDLGGTKLASAIVDATGKMSCRRKVAVNRDSVHACVEQLAGAVREATSTANVNETPIRAVGIIVPGIYFVQTGNVWTPNLWGDEQVPLCGELQRLLSLPVVIGSDRAGYVLGEQWLGVARGVDDVVFLSVGTGIGAGIIAGGRLLQGWGDIAGAVGWFALSPEHQEIYQKIGCWEAEASAPALARRVGAASAEQVIAAARKGDVAAKRAIEETGRYLGMGIANIVSILNPKLVVLGGGLMQAGDLFLGPIHRTMKEWAQPIAAQQVRIQVTSLGENSGLFGAARLALESFSTIN